MPDKVRKTDADWLKQLTPLQFDITRRQGTERLFTGEYDKVFTPGTYRCICCGAALFESGAKFDSGCGWPAFSRPSGGAVKEEMDFSHGMARTEVMCAACDTHLGHVFDDGPGPTGLRYCINSAALKLDTGT